MNTCKNSRDRKHFNQLLNRPEVEGFIRHIIAKGDRRIKTLIIIYLRANVIINVKEEIESMPVRMPFSENILRLFPVVYENVSIKLEKDISVCFPKIFCPNEQINVVISEVASIMYVQSVKEKFIKIATRNNLTKNLYGVSILSPE